MISFKTRKDKEHMLKKAKQMKEYVDDYVECLEDSMAEDEMYSERRGYRGGMRNRYEEYDEPYYRSR